MLRKATVIVFAISCISLLTAASNKEDGTREFRVGSGGELVLDLKAGGTVEISGTGGSTVSVSYEMECTPECSIDFEESKNSLNVTTRFAKGKGNQYSDIVLRIEVPSRFDVKLDSVGGGLSIDGVEGKFTGKTHGGEIVLHEVWGEAELTTMGGEITLTDSELDGLLKTMGGQVLFENVVGDIRGKSMGGNVRYKNVERRDGKLGSPPRTGGDLDASTSETVQISTMGGAIEVDEAREGADVHTMGGKIEIRDADRFVRAKTMGGDILIDAVDGWVEAITMGGDVDVTVTGSGGDVKLISMSGDITLQVPSGFSMELDLAIAYTRNSQQDYKIDTPYDLQHSVSDDWDREKGSPRKFIRAKGSTGGANSVRIETVNGNITVAEGR
jgi:DUF4097 and DUF4098 domain-containing protein YvlB